LRDICNEDSNATGAHTVARTTANNAAAATAIPLRNAEGQTLAEFNAQRRDQIADGDDEFHLPAQADEQPNGRSSALSTITSMVVGQQLRTDMAASERFEQANIIHSRERREDYENQIAAEVRAEER
jgi:hypothetical protein